MSPTFNPVELGDHLDTTPTRRLHDLYGRGFHYDLQGSELEVYPDAKTIRYQSEGFTIAMSGETLGATYGTAGVIFEDRSASQLRHVSIDRDGMVFASIHPLEEAPPRAEPPASNTKTETEEKNRVVVTGRAGRDPRVGETKTGVLVAKFPLAEKTEANATVWHNVVAFRDRAKDVSENVKKGQELKVVGYRHERPGPKGKPVVEIYAASVKPPSKKSGGGEEQ